MIMWPWNSLFLLILFCFLFLFFSFFGGEGVLCMIIWTWNRLVLFYWYCFAFCFFFGGGGVGFYYSCLLYSFVFFLCIYFPSYFFFLFLFVFYSSSIFFFFPFVLSSLPFPLHSSPTSLQLSSLSWSFLFFLILRLLSPLHILLFPSSSYPNLVSPSPSHPS